MSRRKQAKPRSLKGHDGRIHVMDDSKCGGKKRCYCEKRKETDEEKKRHEQEKDEAKPNDHTFADHEDGRDLGFKVADPPKCTRGETFKDHQILSECERVNTVLKISKSHISSETTVKSKQAFSDQYEQISAMASDHLTVLDDLQNSMGNFEDKQTQNCAFKDNSLSALSPACTCASYATPNSSFSSPATPTTAELTFQPMAPCGEKRKPAFVSNNAYGIQSSKKLKVFNNCVDLHNHIDPKAHQQTMDKKILNFPSEQKEHKKEGNVMLGHSVLLEAAITAAVQTVLQCSFCPTSLKDLKELQEHVRQSHNSAVIESNVFFCSHCLRGFLTKETLDTHVQQTHCKNQSRAPDPDILEDTTEGRALLFCPHCTHLPTFGSKLKLMQHIKKMHKMDLREERSTLGLTSPKVIKSPAEKTGQPSTDFICDYCGAKYISLDLFQTHLSSHLKGLLPKHTCSECFKDFPNQESLNEHTISHFSHTSTLYTCESCSKSFTSVKDLHGHLLEMHTLMLYRCSICQQAFSSKVSIQIHLASKHSNKRTTFHCTSCEWDFKHERDLHLHVQQKHLDKQCKVYCCIFCMETFKTDIELQCHITTHSDKCDPCVCTKTSSPLEVPLHEKLRAKSRSTEGSNVTPPPVSKPVAKDSVGTLPADNEIRDGTTESLFSPESKGKVNMNDPMFACEICGASYTMQSLLANHQLRDHHIQPGESGTVKRKVEAIQGSHKCKDCSKTFFTEMALWEHVQTHLGPTKHCQCPICGERFPSLLTLTEHKVTHSRSLDTGNCRICKLPLHSEEDFLEHCQRHPDLHNSLTGFRCVVCMQTVTSTIELKIHGTFHMQKVQGDGMTNGCAEPFDPNPDLKIYLSGARRETLSMNVSTFEHRFRESKTNVSVVNCCSATALIPEERTNKNALTQTTTV
ncbi:zinc finger protein 521 [Triplophysa rosa]|uniref:Zinc finger protein 521-like n=1 Tax=Triplophysa rosa TaxID=992332 RepID=A0A9W7TLL9_TRIRA|nr:zinc finger protein 521 [Triplophysa rosa]KAI7799445.1 putative zinc finger protein 521-like [Triplophysa rosa]